MYRPNGRLRLRKRTTKLERLSACVSLLLIKLRSAEPPVKVLLLIAAVMLLALLSGCATQSPPDQWPKNPQPPQVLAPPSTGTYLQKVETLLEKWRSLVNGTAPM